jgi:uncharacterized protein YbbC (DUF1343 family)
VVNVVLIEALHLNKLNWMRNSKWKRGNKIGCFLMMLLALSTVVSTAQSGGATKKILAGADRIKVYLPLLKGKTVAVFANHTSMVQKADGGYTHLVDTLLSLGINIKKIFAPEHGFRGQADAGEHVKTTIDSATSLPIISLYGNHTKPTKEELADVDLVVFDIQDVGVRFYTYISSLQDLMEATQEIDKPLLVLDRPNPNAFYVDGPVLVDGYQSFIGKQKIPVVYGMTIGEYAMMIGGEGWLSSDKANKKMAYNRTLKPTADTPFHFMVIKCGNYTHQSKYDLPFAPSPNLKDMQAIYLYPSTCFFEGTDFSLGRGTEMPFKVYGHPLMPKNLFSFTPVSTPGAANPPQKNNTCYGYNLSEPPFDMHDAKNHKINLGYILSAYKEFPQKDLFFLKPAKANPKHSDYFFNKLAGNDQLMWQIMNGKTEEEIRKSWEPGLNTFKKIRVKYLLYE